jgi:transposase
MTDEDARSLPGAAQAALRKRAVRVVLDGMTQAEAARVFGVHPNAVNRWIRRYADTRALERATVEEPGLLDLPAAVGA